MALILRLFFKLSELKFKNKNVWTGRSCSGGGNAMTATYIVPLDLTKMQWDISCLQVSEIANSEILLILVDNFMHLINPFLALTMILLTIKGFSIKTQTKRQKMAWFWINQDRFTQKIITSWLINLKSAKGSVTKDPIIGFLSTLNVITSASWLDGSVLKPRIPFYLSNIS